MSENKSQQEADEALVEVAEVQEDYAALQEENVKLKERLLLLAADYDNFRKRSTKMVEDASKFAVNSFSKDMIDILENLFLTMNNVPEDSLKNDEVVKSIYQAVEMTKNTLLNIFARNGIKRILPAQGEIFDHNFHEAVTNIPQADMADNSIVNVMRAGYMLHDRLIKPAMVVVVKNS